MNIDNARGLKASLLENVTANFAEASAVRSLGIRTQKADPAKTALRTIAIGISGKGKQHQLAIRLQRRLLEDHPLITKIRKQGRSRHQICG